MMTLKDALEVAESGRFAILRDEALTVLAQEVRKLQDPNVPAGTGHGAGCRCNMCAWDSPNPGGGYTPRATHTSPNPPPKKP